MDKRPRCTFCQNPWHKPAELLPFPKLQEADKADDQEWTCVKCDAATRTMDRNLRTHYVKLGIIRPAKDRCASEAL